MYRRDVHLPLRGLQLAAFATLLRSVALDRWITVVVTVGLLVAVHAAERGRTWGVALSFALGISLASMVAFGVAPLWFALVAVLAVLPFVRAFPLFLRFDRGAAVTLGALAATMGGLGAMAWKEYAVSLFNAFPMLHPSIYPHHGLAVLALLGGGLLARRFLPGAAAEKPTTTASMDPARVRIAHDAHDAHDAEDAARYEELEDADAADRARRTT